MDKSAQSNQPGKRPSSGQPGTEPGSALAVGSKGNWQAYEERVSRVTGYIHEHLDEPLDLDRLAEVACLSRFHWHRVYRAIQGETVANTLKRVRMTRAGFDLVESELSLAAIARRSGYPNPRSFSRAFADIYGVTPAAYRRSGGRGQSQKPHYRTDCTMYTVTVEDLPERSTIGLLHKGSYTSIGESFERLVSITATRGLMPHMRGMVGIYYDDPMGTPEDELRSRASIIVDDPTLADAPLEAETLVGGRYAVLTLTGPYSDLPAAYDWLYAVWLKQSDHALRAAPPYEDYLNNPRDTPASELITKICVPLES
ncbi:MAG: AraC family transcriptional regulator [Devosiaceae bacterium]|nr:AraC family transcriptional regulator [Devosiaceae bacterium MH13]